MISYHYTDSELNKILKTLTIVIDTRENVNGHILDYLRQKDIPIKIKKLDTGDYGCMIPKNEELGITRDIFLNSRVERKAHMDEITGNLQKDTQTAFENELIRSKDIPFTLIVEDLHGYEKMLKGKYRSQYNPLALLGRLNTFKARYNFEIVYVDQKNIVAIGSITIFIIKRNIILKQESFNSYAERRTNMILIQHMEDYYRSELLKMGYFKTPDGMQLYELDISRLQEIYEEVKTSQN